MTVVKDAIFYWDREAPASWHEEVARLAPKTDQSSHLLLWWEPGTPAAPAQRWVIYQAVPFQYVPPVIMDAFLADPPCQCARRGDWLEGRCPKCGGVISPARLRIAKHLYETGMFARPYWVIQGHAGGHRRLYSQVEQQAARLRKLPDQPPETGALSYAPMDQRVVRRIRRHDLAQRTFGSLQRAAGAEAREAKVAFHTALDAYVDEAFEREMDAVPVRLRGSMGDELPLNHTTNRRVIDYDAERDRFINQE